MRAQHNAAAAAVTAHRQHPPLTHVRLPTSWLTVTVCRDGNETRPNHKTVVTSSLRERRVNDRLWFVSDGRWELLRCSQRAPWVMCYQPHIWHWALSPMFRFETVLDRCWFNFLLISEAAVCDRGVRLKSWLQKDLQRRLYLDFSLFLFSCNNLISSLSPDIKFVLCEHIVCRPADSWYFGLSHLDGKTTLWSAKKLDSNM